MAKKAHFCKKILAFAKFYAYLYGNLFFANDGFQYFSPNQSLKKEKRDLWQPQPRARNR
jgi:hypothetical protein